jgi:regulatory protein
VISDETVLRLGLRHGDEIDAAILFAEAEKVRAGDLAMRALERRNHSAREIELLLMRKNVARPQVTATVARLVSLGLIDDAQFAQAFVRSKVSARGSSVWAMRRDLARKGVARALADGAISDVMGAAGMDDTEMAHREGAKKWRLLSRLDPVVARRRLVSFLQRRGFSGDAVRAAARQLTKGEVGAGN